MRDVCLDAIADDLLWEPTAHVAGVPVEIHGGGKQYALEGGRRGPLTISLASCTHNGFVRRWCCSLLATIDTTLQR